MLAVTGPLAVVKFLGIIETGWGIVVFPGVFSLCEGSDFIISLVVGIRLSPLLGDNGQYLAINRLANVGTVLGHGIGPLGEIDITDRMAGVAVAVVLGIRVAGCSSIGEILWTGTGVLPLPWGFGLG